MLNHVCGYSLHCLFENAMQISVDKKIKPVLVQIVARNMRNENEGMSKIHMDCKVVWEMLTADRLKSNQCRIDRGSIISKILEIKGNRRHNSNTCM